MPSTTRYKFGDIVLIQFPKTDTSASIRRPGLVLLDSGDDDILAARITTHPPRSKGDLQIQDWKSCGLMALSTVRLSKMATVDKSLVARLLGTVPLETASAIRSAYTTLLD